MGIPQLRETRCFYREITILRGLASDAGQGFAFHPLKESAPGG